MLNPNVPKKVVERDTLRYILPDDIANSVLQQNSGITTGRELRLQGVYTYEVWKRLKSLGLTKLQWPKIKVMDACCGTGFLSYHLLSVVRPLEMTLVDTSESELQEAERLIETNFPGASVKYVKADILKTFFRPESFDLIIGNSFLHHLYNVPLALAEFKRLLRPGGLFVTLHEPTPAAVAYEAGSLGLIRDYFLLGARYIERLRKEDAESATASWTDVWLFVKDEVRNLFYDAGFEKVVIKDWHFFRPIVVAIMKLHLKGAKQKLALREEFSLRGAIFADSILNKCLPPFAFASLCLLAEKPHG